MSDASKIRLDDSVPLNGNVNGLFTEEELTIAREDLEGKLGTIDPTGTNTNDPTGTNTNDIPELDDSEIEDAKIIAHPLFESVLGEEEKKPEKPTTAVPKSPKKESPVFNITNLFKPKVVSDIESESDSEPEPVKKKLHASLNGEVYLDIGENVYNIQRKTLDLLSVFSDPKDPLVFHLHNKVDDVDLFADILGYLESFPIYSFLTVPGELHVEYARVAKSIGCVRMLDIIFISLINHVADTKIMPDQYQLFKYFTADQRDYLARIEVNDFETLTEKRYGGEDLYAAREVIKNWSSFQMKKFALQLHYNCGVDMATIRYYYGRIDLSDDAEFRVMCQALCSALDDNDLVRFVRNWSA
ncbi:hypothetical protein BNJ_00160 [Kaumoebavirus]|uniref:hypothetical protein n=1 Tax=Kaumoebavirus TaxID=1859492 RepID=UPI0009C3A1C4|nr:hypothetical protein BNJ_00160 [Kaumoebavirus]ARA71992.1 hypothetical protein BNJ_00160 [Kaumoebavirus]